MCDGVCWCVLLLSGVIQVCVCMYTCASAGVCVLACVKLFVTVCPRWCVFVCAMCPSEVFSECVGVGVGRCTALSVMYSVYWRLLLSYDIGFMVCAVIHVVVRRCMLVS